MVKIIVVEIIGKTVIVIRMTFTATVVEVTYHSIIVVEIIQVNQTYRCWDNMWSYECCWGSRRSDYCCWNNQPLDYRCWDSKQLLIVYKIVCSRLELVKKRFTHIHLRVYRIGLKLSQYMITKPEVAGLVIYQNGIRNKKEKNFCNA